jgi:DNA-directed RNA polymerase subunit RPC12/RpoP
VKVNVPDEFYEKAQELIEEINKKGEEEENIFEVEAGPGDVCPNCGSKNIAPTIYSRWSLLPSFIFLFPILLGRKKWQCKSCGCKWK